MAQTGDPKGTGEGGSTLPDLKNELNGLLHMRGTVGAARVMASGAPLWLLDEPLNGLDRHAVGLCEALVADHCARGGLAVIASHQPFAVAGLRELHLPNFTPGAAR